MRKQFEPYIRRWHSGDKSESIRVALQMLGYEESHVACFVVLQRGFPKRVLAVGLTKRQLIGSIMGARTAAIRRGGDWKEPKLKDFRIWARRVRRLVNPEKDKWLK